MDHKDLVTVRDLAAESPAFSEAALRWYVFNATSNGLDNAIVRVGRKVLIHRPGWNRWLESQRVKVAA